MEDDPGQDEHGPDGHGRDGHGRDGHGRDRPAPDGHGRDAPGASRRLPRRRLIVLGTTGAAACLVAGAGITAARSRDAQPSGGTGSAASGTAAADAAGPFDPRLASAALANRARAVRDGDRIAFLATVRSAPPAFQQAQSQLFDNLRRIPLDAWEERLLDGRPVRAVEATAVLRVEVRYRLRGFDRDPVRRIRHLTFAPRSGGWVITGDGTGQGFADESDIWDGGALHLVRGRSCLVIGDGPEPAEISRRLDAAVPAVTRVVGRGWPRRAVALVPADPARAAALAGRRQDLREIAALATVVPAAGGGRGGDRIIIAPDTFGRLNDLGRDVVLTHELTHVATGGAADARTPLWLIEGLADYVGYLGAGVGVRSAAGELAAEVAAGRLPAALPGRDAFAGASGRLSQSYQEAWLACRMIAERYGEATLVRLYRTAGRAPEAAALRDVLGLTRDRLTALWRDYLEMELG